jgi:zinc transport system substrate-binding protein
MIIAGMPFEKRLAARLGGREDGPQVVDLSVGRTLLPGDEDELDLHYWMDPLEGLDIAKRTAEALKLVFPAEAGAIDGRLAKLQAEIQAVDLELEALLAPHRGEKVFVYHGAYGYLCRRYGLTQVSLGIGGKEPGAAQVHGLLQEAAHDHAHGILVQPQYAGGARSFAGKLDAVAIQADPLAGDYLEVLRGSAKAVVEALSGHDGAPTAGEGAGPK